MNKNNKMNTLISLKAEIQAQIEGQEKIQKFCFEDINIEQFSLETVKLISKYTDLTCLEFNDCKLTQLENLIGFNNVVKLRLCNNNLDNRCLSHIVDHFPNLRYLDLSGNRQISQDDLKVLAGLKDLQHLIYGVREEDREAFFKLIPTLHFIDEKDKEGNEAENDDEEDEDEESDEDEEDEEESGEDEEEADEGEESSEQPPKKKQKL